MAVSVPFTRHSELTPPPSPVGTFLGFLLASGFSFVYLVAPVYIIGCLLSFLYNLLTLTKPSLLTVPFVVSVLLPPIHAPAFVSKLTPLMTYFKYSEIRETSDEDMLRMMEKENKKFILAATPHGVISFTGMCSAVYCIPEFRNIHTAAASAVLQTPILKHVMGIFGLTNASGKNLMKHFKKKGVKGSVVLYVLDLGLGGEAERADRAERSTGRSEAKESERVERSRASGRKGARPGGAEQSERASEREERARERS
jgi:hypothetical protein